VLLAYSLFLVAKPHLLQARTCDLDDEDEAGVGTPRG